MKFKLCLLVIFFVLFSGFKPGTRNFDSDFGRNHNVCKKMKGKVLLYVVWVETRNSTPWSDFELNTTVDALKTSLAWVEAQAKKSGVDLVFQFGASTNDSVSAVYQRLGGTVPELTETEEGLVKIDKWTNKIVKIASGRKTKLELVTDLRNEYRAESVALVYMLCNYYKSDYIYSFNTTSNEDVEYAIVSSKKPTLITQSLMNLFGAPYLYHHPSTANKRNTKNVQKLFYNDVMANTDFELDQLEVGPITKYFLGWADTLSAEYEKMVKEKPKF